jgi:hypothetical protein
MECELSDAIRWELRKQSNRLQISPQSQIAYHMSKARKSLRREKFTTPSGKVCRLWMHRTVQAPNSSGQIVQRDLWANIHDYINHPNGDVALTEGYRQRLAGVEVDVDQIKEDIAGTNELRTALGYSLVQIRFNFWVK